MLDLITHCNVFSVRVLGGPFALHVLDVFLLQHNLIQVNWTSSKLDDQVNQVSWSRKTSKTSRTIFI